MHEKVGHFFASVKNGHIISKDAFKVLKSGVIGSDKWNLPLVCFFLYCKRVFLSFVTILIAYLTV